MTKTLRHALLMLVAMCMVVACEDNTIPSDKLGTDGIIQGKISYDTIPNMREASGDTIDVAEAVRLGLELPSGSTTSQSYYVLGYVKGITTPLDPSYGNVTINICNALNNRQMLCYRLMSFKGAKFTDANQVKIGDIVVVYGQIQNRYGAPQFTQGCRLVTSNNPESGYVPGPKVLVKESFDANMGVFAIVNKQAASSDVWQHVEATETAQGFMRANGKIGDSNEAAESWLVSPVMDLTACGNGVELTFSHYCFYNGDISERNNLLRVMVTTDGSNWTQLPIADEMWNANARQKRFTTAIIDLAQYISATTQIAFAYKSTTDVAMQWAVQNVRIGEPGEDEN